MDAKLSDLFQKMGPVEIRNKEFKKAMWGYSPQEVAEFLDGVAKSWERIQKTEKDLNDRLRTVGEELTRWKNRELEISKLREKALQEAETIRADAQAEAQKLYKEVEERANDIREKTEEWLTEVIARVEETERQKNHFMTAFRSALDSHYELLQTEQEEKEPLGAQLTHFLRSATSAAPLAGNATGRAARSSIQPDTGSTI